MAPKPSYTLTQLADRAHTCIATEDAESRAESLTELLCGLGAIGRKVAEHAGLIEPGKRRRRVTNCDGQLVAEFAPIRDHAAAYAARKAKARAAGTTVYRQRRERAEARNG